MVVEEACRALREKRILTCSYDGRIRFIEVHAVGVDSKGVEAVFGWLVRGVDSDASVLGWRHFKADKMENIALTGEKSLAPRPGFQINALNMRRIFAHV